jgi:probable phosphoglycerate mutase
MFIIHFRIRVGSHLSIEQTFFDLNPTRWQTKTVLGQRCFHCVMFVLLLTGATLIVRHGETDWNQSGRAQGQRNEPRLTARGREQAARTAQWIQAGAADQIHTLAVSTLQRARESARFIEEAGEMSKKWKRWYTELLWEVYVPWQGEWTHTMDDRHAEAYRIHRQEPHRCPHFAELYNRAEQFWSTRNAPRTRDTFWVVVAHQQCIRALLNSSTGVSRALHRVWRIANGGCCLLDNQQCVHLINGPSGTARTPDTRDIELICESTDPVDAIAQEERGEHGQLRIRGTPATLQRYLSQYVPGLPADKFVWYPGGRSCFRASTLSSGREEHGSVWFHNIHQPGEHWPLDRYLEACRSTTRTTM